MHSGWHIVVVLLNHSAVSIHGPDALVGVNYTKGTVRVLLRSHHYEHKHTVTSNEDVHVLIEDF